ncbi:MAG: hypothetical protein HQ564_01310 [Candidatus Saganbacteria bacterium]|nr:hypothetical protein [Candidatus Saganbacteria bacterium]
MSKLRRLLHNNPISLIVNLWENNPESAKLAENAGADALMINDLDNAEQICKSVKIPTGIVLRDARRINKRALQGLDFINFEMEHSPQFKNVPHTRILMLDEKFSIDSLLNLSDKAEAIDAAIVPLTQGVKDLVVGDLQNYISIIISADLPVLIPTQRSIKPSEVAIIWDAGAKGIILTKTVLGNTARSFEKTIREFRIAVDDLGN